MRREAGDDAQNPRQKRLRGKTTTGAADNTVYMLKKPTTKRGHLKQLEKEIPWTAIPEEERAAFRAAEQTQWEEHVRCQALQPVGIQESREIMRARPERVLPSRFAYRDKNFAKRRISAETPSRHKSRLVVGGHLDPDIATGQLATSAPTVSRRDPYHAPHLRVQTGGGLDGRRRRRNSRLFEWGATIQGIVHQAASRRTGRSPPEQLVKLTKWVFGLTTAQTPGGRS